MNFNISNHSSLLEVLKTPKGYFFKRGIGCTYSANERTFLQLKRQLGVDLDENLLGQFDSGESFRLYVQQGCYEGQAHNAICGINPKKGVLHAKVYVICYEPIKKGRLLYRIVVASANLTGADELNICAVLNGEKGTVKQGEKSPLGETVKDFFTLHFKEYDQKTVTDKYKYFFDGLISVDFGSDKIISFIDVNPKDNEAKKGLDWMREEKDVTSITVISPFIGKETLKQLLEKLPNGKEKEFTVISRSDEINRCEFQEKNVKYFTLKGDSLSAEDGETRIADALHAKIYVFQKQKKEGPDVVPDVVYLGSANATQSAFGDNIEALVRIEEKVNLDSCKDIFASYDCDWQPSESDEGEHMEFEGACRSLLRAFRYDRDHYYIDAKVQADKYAITLKSPDGKELTENSQENALYLKTWNRHNQYKHTCILTIRDTSKDYTKDYTMVVDGQGIPVDEYNISKVVEESILDELFTYSGNESKGDGKRHSLDRADSQRPELVISLAGKLAALDNIQSIKATWGKCEELKERMPHKDNNEFKETLEEFCKACKELRDEGIIND